MEIQKILVGVDGGPAAAAALRWAADAVRESGGEVVAVHAADRVLIRQAADDAVNGLGMAASLRKWRGRGAPAPPGAGGGAPPGGRGAGPAGPRRQGPP